MPRAFMDGIEVGLSLVDVRTGRATFANSEFCRILGYSEDDLVGKNISLPDLIHPDDRERNEVEFRRILAGETSSYRIDVRHIFADGNILWAHVAVRGIRDSNGELRWCSAAAFDITASKLIERQLLAAREVAGLATWIFEVETNSSETSPGYNALFGVSPQTGSVNRRSNLTPYRLPILTPLSGSVWR